MSRPTLTDIPPQTQQHPGTITDLEPAADHGERTWTARERLTGKRVLITGGDSGIGRATAITMSREGAEVAISYLPEEQRDAEDTKTTIESAGGVCHLLPADLTTIESNQDVARAAVEALGGLDVLVCNAAFQMTYGKLEDFPAEQIQHTYTVNVFSPFWLAQALAGELEDGGCIIITTSIQAYNPSEELLDYASTKAALNNLVVNLASELGPRGIRVNAVAPGPIWTPLIPSTMPEEKVSGFGSDTPLGRAGHPVEVAAAYVFLASDEASYVSGTVLGVTGGKPVF
ncbi:SDR family oxidoreductase [Nostocoides sp. F2B08]|uniref:SDR family oxidoreductase n=1 Tax=Nostocoides sp. F2B08 TaxID=2653936 RepID=UPI00126323AA|nr:SDR family oxidoreductase [Tetrasphaera sp. F2B08]KAB7744038.1 SDR family oxidoreductase [Tetrasphaera sp. F2B08]